MTPRSPLRRCLPLALALLALAPARAHAFGAVAGPEGQLVSLSTVRVAIATEGARTTRWAQVTVTGTTTGFAWMVPVQPGARLDLASDAWLDALDVATVPVVLPPVTGCPSGSEPDRTPAASSPSSVTPTETEVLFDVASVTAFVTQAGYVMPAALPAELQAAIARGAGIAVMLYPSATLPTHTVRITDGGPASLPFALSGSSLADVSVTAFVIAAGPEVAGTPAALDPSGVVWQGDGQSSYTQVSAALLGQWQGTEWLIESSMPGLLFTGAPVEGAASQPPVLGTYYTLASSYGDTTGDPTTCLAAAMATSQDPTSYPETCPGGRLAVVPGASPCPEEAGSDAGPPPLTCGASDDATLAAGGLSPQQIWVTRIAGIVTQESASDVSLALSSAVASQSPVLTAGQCAPEEGSTPTSGGGGGGGAGSSGSASTGNTTGTTAADVADTGCAAALGGLDGCDSDSSDSSDGGCDCGSGSDSGGCDSGGDSGGCDSGGSNDCSTARRSHRSKNPISRVLLFLAVAAAVKRRTGTMARKQRQARSAGGGAG